MMNKPIFILSDSYQRYANFKTNTEYNSQSVAFINELGKESVILGSDLNNTKFRFVPDAPTTNSDLVLKSNNGVFSWVAFPTSGGTTVGNGGIEPPFDLKPDDYYSLSWSYYIRSDYDSTGMETAMENAPVGTIFSHFGVDNGDEFDYSTDGLSVKVLDFWGYEGNLAHIPLELDPKHVATRSGGLIEDCSILRLFITNQSSGFVNRSFTLDKPYMSYNKADKWVYINGIDPSGDNGVITKIVTEDRLNSALKDILTSETQILPTITSTEMIDVFVILTNVKNTKYVSPLDDTIESISNSGFKVPYNFISRRAYGYTSGGVSTTEDHYRIVSSLDFERRLHYVDTPNFIGKNGVNLGDSKFRGMCLIKSVAINSQKHGFNSEAIEAFLNTYVRNYYNFGVYSTPSGSQRYPYITEDDNPHNWIEPSGSIKSTYVWTEPSLGLSTGMYKYEEKKYTDYMLKWSLNTGYYVNPKVFFYDDLTSRTIPIIHGSKTLLLKFKPVFDIT